MSEDQQGGVGGRRLFALDHNFPQPLVASLGPYIREAELVAIERIHWKLPELPDWEVLLALHRHERPWDGLVTNDAKMLRLAREMAVLHQTKLTLVVASGAGDDPLKATGLLLTHLPHICGNTNPGRAQIWELTARDRAERAWDQLERLAEKAGQPVKEFVEAHKLSEPEFARDPLAGLPATRPPEEDDVDSGA